ncbi:MAG: TIGR04255 family protein [Phycisphaeraceae bacterium]|nr:TIGR04255 family protein [Phycisphaeraceae bacterium]
MDQALPSFRKPPVIETALSVQFRPLKRMSNAHLGLFWSRVRGAYPKLQDADPIEPQIERFGTDVPRVRFPQLRIAASHPPARLRMSSASGHVMLQLQNGRLVFNWRRLDGENEYPRWTRVEPQFQAALRELTAFADAEELGAIEPNQWEVTYVNHLVRGREWNASSEWQAVLPGVIGSTGAVSVGEFESMGCHAHFALPDNAGRLHVEVTHGFAGPDEDADELLIVQLTARGGIDESRDVAAGLALGREAIVRSFGQMAGERVRTEVWEQEATAG